MGDVAKGGGYGCVGEGVHGISPYLQLNFAVKLKLTKKMKKEKEKERKRKRKRKREGKEKEKKTKSTLNFMLSTRDAL